MAKSVTPTKTTRELNKLIKNLPDDKKTIAKNIINVLSFISATLEDLKTKIAESGTVELFEQGKQKFYREAPALKSYNTTVQRYSLLYKQLIDLLRSEGQKPSDSGELFEFINGGQK